MSDTPCGERPSVVHSANTDSSTRGNLMNFMNDEGGATAIEYGLLASLISVVIIGAVTAIGTSLSTTFQEVSNQL